MKLDIAIHKGDKDKPVIIFIHGLGVDKSFWTDPAETKVLGGNIPMRIFAAVPPKPCSLKGKKRRISAGDVPEKIDNLWTAVTNKGFSAVCWSQSRPVGPIDAAVEELEEVLKQAKKTFPGRPVALIGHSRGGVIARKFMEGKAPEIKALITISTPHAGSSLSRLGKYISPLSPFFKKILPIDTHGTVSRTIKRVTDLIDGNALKELLPGSDFIKNMKDIPSKKMICLSFGGTKTKLLTVYKWKKKDNRMYPEALLDIPDSLLKKFPASAIPEEIISGRGDFMVTAESSAMPGAQTHFDLPANHISISWHKKTIGKTLEVLEKI
jgi:pimeloyl-ACP methyl ester carboxylesterase